MLYELDLDEIVKRSWLHENDTSIIEKLDNCVSDLDQWGRKLRNIFQEDIEKCKRHMERHRECSDAGSVEQFKAYKDRLSLYYYRKRDSGNKEQRLIGFKGVIEIPSSYMRWLLVGRKPILSFLS